MVGKTGVSYTRLLMGGYLFTSASLLPMLGSLTQEFTSVKGQCMSVEADMAQHSVWMTRLETQVEELQVLGGAHIRERSIQAWKIKFMDN